MTLRHRLRHRAVLPAILVTSIFAAPEVRAADDPACIQAYEQTQALRKQSKLRDARDQAAKCARDACPAVLSRDCAKWFTELEQSIPTVVFDVRGSDGFELTTVKVAMDGKPLLDKLDGKSVPVDIGAHVFKFELIGATQVPAAERQVVVHEGDKNRKISVVFKKAVSDERPIPFMAWVFGGVSAVAIGAGGYFAIKGLSAKGDLDDCKPSCSADKVNDVSTSYAYADILLSAGVVSGLAALYIYMSRPLATEESAPAAAVPAQASRSLTPSFDVGPTRGGAAANLTFEF